MNDTTNRKSLKQLEAIVERWVASTEDAAKALVEIKTSELYKKTHSTFEEYVNDRWQKTKQWAYDLCAWYEINKSAGTEDAPLNMSATRALKPLRKNPDKLRDVVAAAKKIAQSADRSSPTVKDVEAAKLLILPPRAAAQPKSNFDVSLSGPNLDLIRKADLDAIGNVAENEGRLDVQDVDLADFFKLLTNTANEFGSLSVSLTVTQHQRTPDATSLTLVS